MVRCKTYADGGDKMNLYEMIAGCVLCICFFTFMCFAIVYARPYEKTDNKEIEKSSVPTWSSTEETIGDKK